MRQATHRRHALLQHTHTDFPGPVTFSSTTTGLALSRADLDSGLVLRGGNGAGSGAGLSLFGPSHATAPSYAYLDGDLINFRNVAGTAIMTLRVVSGGGVANLGAIAGDPAAPQNGDIWYNSSTGKFRGRAAGANVDLH